MRKHLTFSQSLDVLEVEDIPYLQDAKGSSLSTLKLYSYYIEHVESIILRRLSEKALKTTILRRNLESVIVAAKYLGRRFLIKLVMKLSRDIQG